MTKVDYKRELRDLCSARREPVLVEVPEFGFLMVDGHGDPNMAPGYRQAVEALYVMAYAAKFILKRRPDGVDFAVMPLEGLWWTSDTSEFTIEDKAAWDWTMTIMQPDPVTPDLIEETRASAAKKKQQLGALADVRLERFREARAAQVLHSGPYAEEGPTIAALHEFIARQGMQPAGKHREVYLSNPARSAPERMKTILRQPVAPAPGG